jgi:hypothetical protein
VSPAEFRDLVGTALNQPTDVSRLRLYLAELGVDAERPAVSQFPDTANPGSDSLPAKGAATAAAANDGRVAAWFRKRRDRIVAGVAALVGSFVIVIIVVVMDITSGSSHKPMPPMNPALTSLPALLYSTGAPIVVPTDILGSFATDGSSGHGG